ncbi:MAG: N-acetylmuramic acid 6-phosphate etherase [Bacteroidota bacterium]
MDKKPLTESDSHYDHLEKMRVGELLKNINKEDKTIADSVEVAIPQIERLVENIIPRMLDGGRLFYLGAGTSGRLGIVDASECPPTFGVSDNLVIGLIAGGDRAIRKAVEFAEDDKDQGWKDLLYYDPNKNDTLIGIAASGTTPFVVGAIEQAGKCGLLTGCITANLDTPLALASEYPIEIVVGPEFITGSTRMKAGTAQKLALNMISTTVMIKLGRIEGNKMIDMQPTNKKLMARGVDIIMKKTGKGRKEALDLLQKHGSVRKVLTRIINP